MSKELFDLTGKLALITGSSSGTGLTIAKGLAKAGCAIAINGIDEKRIKDTVASLKKESYLSLCLEFDF